MRWEKLGLVPAPGGTPPWALHSALTPTPVLHQSGCIRVYASFRDGRGIGRIGFVDLDPDSPTRVLRISKTPALDIGRPGSFDDNGVILGDVLEDGGTLLLFYVGFQLTSKVKFLAFSGMARSEDGGDNFRRISEAPVLDRSDEGLLFRAIHSVRKDAGRWKIWYGAGSTWTLIEDTPYPTYQVFQMESQTLESLPRTGRLVISYEGREYRIGRPRVYAVNCGYMMLYTKGSLDKSYLPGMAVSSDGVSWKRCDSEVGISPSPEGWDSRTVCYPSLLDLPDGRTLMFYNGNDMGREGFGVAMRRD